MSWADTYVDLLRQFGVPFVIRPGWGRQSGGRGDWTYGQPVATVDHHFANGYSSPDGVSMIENGYSGGPAPYVVNQYVQDVSSDSSDDGRLYLISQYPTGHPGKGSREVLRRVMADQAPQGDAAALDLPDDLPQSEAERLYYGTEVQNPGDGTPLTVAQMRTLILADAALMIALGHPAARVIQHREHSRRKPDIHPRALDAFQHRRDVAAAIEAYQGGHRWTAVDWLRLLATVAAG